MFWLLETEEQLDYLKQNPISEAFVEVIPYHDNIHPAINDVSIIYIRPFNDTKGYMVCVHHSETFSVEYTTIYNILKNIDKIWVRDKKTTLYYLPLKQLHCLSPLNPKYESSDTQAHIFYNSRYTNCDYINRIIPVSKHYERCENIYHQVIKILKEPLPSYYDFYNNKAILAFFGIEKNGIKINKEEFDKHYDPNKEFYSIQDNRIYTHYNLDTTTHRPSNSFNNINFAALNKETGARSSFIAEHEFIEFDISAYHPHLAARLVKYDFGDTDIHQVFAEMYGVDYKRSKELTFKQLYGGVFKEYKHLPFFQKISKFIENTWDEFNREGRIKVPISGYYFEKDKLPNMNPQKLFNYILQNIESAMNVLILLDIHKLLIGEQTKIVLYTYDSFLFDIHKNEYYLKEDIENIFKKHKFSVKTNTNTDYDFSRKKAYV